jgi:hypothetical protein
MKNKIIQIFGLQRDSILQNKKIPKAKFYELDDFNAEKKRIFTNDIKDIYLLAILNEETINIAPLKNEAVNYSEVYFIYVELKSIKNIAKIVEVIQKNIQNPVILIFSFENSILVQFSSKRLSNTSQEKQVVEQAYFSQWISIEDPSEAEKTWLNKLNISQFSFKNLYVFCEEYSKLIYQSITIAIFGTFYFYKKLYTIDLQPKIDEYLENQRNTVRLKASEGDALEFSEKMALHEKVIRAEKEGQVIKEKIKIFLESQIK